MQLDNKYCLHKKINKLRFSLSVGGFSLVEMLVVVTVFAILAVVATQALTVTFRGAKKSESVVYVRENLNHAISVIERHIYNAKSVTCPNPDTVRYEDSYGTSPLPEFVCNDSISPGNIASGSAGIKLTTDDIDITLCTFTCIPGAVAETPDTVKISITANATNATGAEGEQVTVLTRIQLRSY